jgi:histidinol-phosphate aminotransferase
MDLSKNINPLKASSDFPISCENKEFKEVIANNFNLEIDTFNIYSCKEQALYSLLHCIKTSHLYIYAPTFTYYEQTALKTNKSIEYINRFIELESELLPHSIVLFTNPSFPDGNCYDLESFLEYWKSQNIIVIIDETYLSFTKKQSLKKQIQKYPNLFIFEELSPFYGVESLHLSLIHSQKQNLENINNTSPSCHISQNEQKLFLAVLNDTPFKSVSSSVSLFNKELLINEMDKLPFIKEIYPSHTNYFLFSIQEKMIEKFKIYLEQNQITITHCEDLEYLDKSFFTLSVPKNKDTKKLITLLQKL